MVKPLWARMFALVNALLIMVNAANANGAENDANSANHGVILQYHHVADSTPAATSVSPDAFKKHMELLHLEGFTVWPLPKLVEALKAQPPVPDKVVVITFDDAYDSIYSTALPILKRYQFPFTVFVSTDYVDRKQSGYMDWQQIRQLAQQGATIANHTKSHLHLLRKPNEVSHKQWMATLRNELEGAEKRIKKETGQNWRYFAYPYGEADQPIVDAIKSWGYMGFGQQSGATDKRLLLSGMAPRFPFNRSYEDLAEFRIKAGSVPFELADESFENRVFTEPVTPELILTFNEPPGGINCFASGQGPIPVEVLSKNTVRVQAPKTIPIGRSRYNCTMSAGKPNRFHWYSRMWIRRDKQAWYPEP